MLDNYLDELSRATRTNGSKNCPNCGAPIEAETCPYCGTVFLDFAAMDSDQPFYMKVKQHGKIYILKVKMTSMEFKVETNDIYDKFGARLLTLIRPISSLTLDFDILN